MRSVDDMLNELDPARDKFARDLINDFLPLLDACADLQTHANRALRDVLTAGIPHGPQVIAVSLFAMARRNYQSVAVAVGHGFPVEGAIVGRTLFETMLDIYWVLAHPDEAPDRLKEHELATRFVFQAAYERYGPTAVHERHFTGAEIAQKERVLSRYGDKLQKAQWSGTNAYERKTALRDRLSTEADRHELDVMYAVAHRAQCLLTHPSPEGISHVIQTDADNNFRGFLFSSNDRYVREALGNATRAFRWAYHGFREAVRTGPDAEFDKIYHEVLPRFAMLRFNGAPKPGRNDPCPCGSRLKFKQCHQRWGQRVGME